MTDGRLWPAPGPLAWLHPELLPLWTPPPRVLDARGRWGRSLREALTRHARWRVARGPTGDCVRASLHGAAELVTSGEADGFDGPEEQLAQAARRHARAPALLATASEAGVLCEPADLEGGADAGTDTVRLLPLRDGPELERDLGRLLERVARAPEAHRRAGWVPFFVPRTRSGADGGAPVTRLAPSWWGVLPGDEYPAGARRAFGELLRLLRPERVLAQRAYENYACAGVDLYADALLGRGREALDVPARPRARCFAVCGIDGAGKSRHVAALREHLEARGLSCAVHKLFRHGLFHDTVTDLTRACAGGQRLHLWRLQRLAKLLDSLKVFATRVAPDLERCDAVVFDRYTYTHFAAGRGRYHADPWARELLAALPAPDRVYLLDLPADEADRRIGSRDERTVDENPYMLARYRHVLLDLADREGFLVLDARAPFEENRARIRDDVDRLLAAGGGSS